MLNKTNKKRNIQLSITSETLQNLLNVNKKRASVPNFFETATIETATFETATKATGTFETATFDTTNTSTR